MKTNLIAPCGMNCNLCKAHIREKNRCPGCNIESKEKAKYCQVCKIKYCDNQNKFCFNCHKYPCTRLKQLDKRYRSKYHMSMIENLNFIREKGIRNFINFEKDRWIKDNKVFCVHDSQYYKVS